MFHFHSTCGALEKQPKTVCVSPSGGDQACARATVAARPLPLTIAMPVDCDPKPELRVPKMSSTPPLVDAVLGLSAELRARMDAVEERIVAACDRLDKRSQERWGGCEACGGQIRSLTTCGACPEGECAQKARRKRSTLEGCSRNFPPPHWRWDRSSELAPRSGTSGKVA